MEKLEIKYRNNNLSSKELKELREKVALMSDSEIEEQMSEVWFNEDIDVSAVNDEQIDRIKKRIDLSIHKRYPVVRRIVRWGQVAAAVLLPVFILLTVFFYRENNTSLSQEMIVSTRKGERANITLPDGTTVYLNSDSQLGYIPDIYNKKERRVDFSGEGYFCVFQDKTMPFYIDSKGLQVQVTGTVFNLSVREQDNTAELSMEEGSVLLTAIESDFSITLFPNEKAILDRQTGHITVIKDEDVRYESAWRNGDMVFRNTSLSQIFMAIEDNYNVKINVRCENCLDDKFTGILPLTDLNEVLEIIEKSYHLNIRLSGKEVFVE